VVAHAAITGERSGLTQFAKLLKPLRIPLRAFHFAADRLLRDSRTSTAITAAMLVCGVLFVLGAGWMPEPPPGLAAVGWSLLFGWTATAVLRRRLTLWLAVGLIGVLLVAALGPEKTVVPLFVVGGLIVLLSVSTWLGAAALSLIILWWSVGSPSCSEIFSAIAAAGMQGLAESLARQLPAGACTIETGTHPNAELLLKLSVPLGLVIVLALLAKLGDTKAK
jgi:hypothetical protein